MFDEPRLVVTSIGSRAEADDLARGAVSARLAACAQVGGPVESTYRWRGELETATEWVVTFKTTASRYSALETYLRHRHPYEVPEILCLPVLGGNPAYLEWMVDQTRDDASAGGAH